MHKAQKRSRAGLVWVQVILILTWAPSGFGGGLARSPMQAQPTTPERPGRVGQRVAETLERAGRARVIVVFSLGQTTSLSAEAFGAPAEARRREIARVSGEILAGLTATDFTLARRMTSIRAFSGEVSAVGITRLLQDSRVVRVDLDAPGAGHMSQAVPLANVDDFRNLGYTGDGVTVAILDSGYDSDHADLVLDLDGETCFCSGGGGCCPNAMTTMTGPGSAEDDHGHGTNVSGIVTSDGTTAPLGGAPDTKIVAVKVLDSSNSFCCSSDVVAGLDWIITNRPDVDVVNMSLGTSSLFAGDCDGATAFTMSYAAAIDALRAMGIPVFASSGNNGAGDSMSAPACVANTIAVGAVWDSNVGTQSFLGCTDVTTAADQVTCFSNSNATTDLFAPGAFTTSTGLGGGTSSFAGTSQASPLSAACAALLLEKAPGLTPAQIEAALESSPTSVTDATNGLSFPRLDCLAAGAPCASPVTLNLSAGAPIAGTVSETACESIVAENYAVGGTGNVTFNAGTSIALGNGFEVAASGVFTAVLNGLLVP